MVIFRVYVNLSEGIYIYILYKNGDVPYVAARITFGQKLFTADSLERKSGEPSVTVMKS